MDEAMKCLPQQRILSRHKSRGLLRLPGRSLERSNAFFISPFRAGSRPERKMPGQSTRHWLEKLGPEIGPRLHRTQPNSLDVIRSIGRDSGS